MKNTAEPRVSIVIPTLQEGKYLRRCLESLAKQSYTNHEVLVVDGGSTDETLAIARAFEVMLIAAPGSTLVTARQLGVEASGGEIIIGADADTVYPPDHIARVVADFGRDAGIVAVGGAGIFEPEPWWCSAIWRLTYAIYAMVYWLTGRVVYVAAFNLSFRKSAFVEAGGYTTYLEAGGDEIDILAKLKKTGRILFDSGLAVYPSSRRAKGGFLSYYLRHGVIGYGLAYLLAQHCKRNVIKYQPVR
jgi:glycosyltransferase involved in cell wall biosynthesis